MLRRRSLRLRVRRFHLRLFASPAGLGRKRPGTNGARLCAPGVRNGSTVGQLLRVVSLTHDENGGGSAGLLTSAAAPTGTTNLRNQPKDNRNSPELEYESEPERSRRGQRADSGCLSR